MVDVVTCCPAYRRSADPRLKSVDFVQRPSGAVLHSSREPGVLSQWLLQSHDDGIINIILVLLLYYIILYYLFVCLSVALRVGVGVWKLYRFVSSRRFRFFRHFCCRMYHWATLLFWDIPFCHNTQKNRTAEIFASGTAMGSIVMWPWLFIILQTVFSLWSLSKLLVA